MNQEKLYRLYREEKLMVRPRGGRKRALGTSGADDPAAHDQPAVVADFVSDTLSDGRRFAYSVSSTTSVASVWPLWSILN
jgi:putative transposase